MFERSTPAPPTEPNKLAVLGIAVLIGLAAVSITAWLVMLAVGWLYGTFEFGQALTYWESFGLTLVFRVLIALVK